MSKWFRNVLLTCLLGMGCVYGWGQGLVFNEVSTAPGSEFFEFVVVGSGVSECELVDLRGYIIDDNNGLFVNCANAPQALAGIGVSDGFLRFSNTNAFWNNVPVGTIIVIYPPGGAVDNDFCDGLITIPVDFAGMFEENTNTPSASMTGDACQNRDCLTNLGDPSYDMSAFNAVVGDPFTFPGPMTINQNNDAWQVRTPAAVFVHGIAYGNGDGGSCGSHPGMSGGPDGLLFTAMPAYQFINSADDDFRNLASWANNQTPSPGLPNSCANAEWIATMRPVINQEFVDDGCSDNVGFFFDTVCIFSSITLSISDDCSSTYEWMTGNPAIVNFTSAINSHSVDVEGLAVGSIDVVLEVTRNNASLDIGGCNVQRFASVDWIVTVVDEPVAEIVPVDTICQTGTFYTMQLTGASTTGGVWSIDNGGFINSATGEVAIDSLSLNTVYTVTYKVGPSICEAIDMVSFTMIDDASVNLLAIPDVCATGFYDANFSAGSTAGGVFTITSPGVINQMTGNINLAASGPGTFTVTYTAGIAPCDDSDSETFTISALPTANDASLDVCDDGSGTATFVLSDAESVVTGGDMTLSVTYHANQADAIAGPGSNPITTYTTSTSPDTVYARVEDGTCFDVALIVLNILPGPTVNPVTINGCVNTNSFDLTTYNDSITTAPSVTWYNGNPASGGTVIGDPTNVDLTTLISLYAVVTDAPCSDTVMITFGYIIGYTIDSVLCNDNGTPSDGTDNFIEFILTVNAVGLGPGFSISPNMGSIMPPTGTYNVTQSYALNPGSVGGGNVILTITDDTYPDCMIDVMIADTAACADTCDLMIATTNILCDDGGTISDSTDDTYTFDLIVTGNNTGTMWTADDAGNTMGPYGVPVAFGPYPISGGNVVVTIMDNADTSCQTDITVFAPATCSNTCSISEVVSNVLCDDNGTPSDPSDDTYSFDVTVSGVNNSLMWIADDAALTMGSYDVAVGFGPYPISGGPINLTITDFDDAGCTTTFMVTPPPTCSDSCAITAAVSNIQCDDQGTLSDSTDDTYTFTVIVTGSNTGSGWTAGDPLGTTGGYGMPVTFGPYPISGGNLSFTISDNDSIGCITPTVSVTAPATCSNSCQISNVVSNIQCDDNGTPSDPSDDTYTFSVLVTGDNMTSSWVAADPNTTMGGYDTSVVFGPYPISGGGLTFNIFDNDSVSCMTEVMVVAPPPCSDSCVISAVISNIQCDENSTPSDSTDDTYTFTVLVTGSNTGTSWTATDPDGTTGSYGTPVIFGPYPISGGDLTFNISDNDSIGCMTTVTAVAPMTCSGTCNISHVVTNIQCQHNGTPSDPSDDTYTFSVTVTGSNTGASWTATDPDGTTGGYGTPVMFGPYPISGGDLSFNISDTDSAGCMTPVMVTAPMTCSNACTITASATSPVCFDGGTPSDPSDDTYTFSVTVNGSNTGSSWTADDPNSTVGGYGTPVTFGPYPISGGNLTIDISDVDSAGCMTTLMVAAPMTCSNACIITASATSPVCADGGTPSDPSDDTYTFSVTVNGSNTGSSWMANDPNSTVGGYGTPVTFGPYPISGGNLTIDISDVDSAGCMTQIMVTTPMPCSGTCNISANATSPVCDDGGTPSDPSDDTYTFSVTVNGSNTGSSWTANDPNSTAGGYGTPVTFGPYPISGGSLIFDISDVDSVGCTTPVTVSPPPTCSDSCTITATVSNIQCQDAGTPADTTDDTYTFEVTVSGNNTAGMWTANDAGSTTGSYGVAMTFGPYPISGGNVSFTITDNNDSGCTTMFTVPAPPTCSNACSIALAVSNFQCDDNGTPSDPSDDLHSFDVIVTGTNTATTWTSNDPNSTTGSYGVTVTFGPYPISDGNVSFTITDDNDAGCTTSISISAPAPCSNTCSISNVVSNVQCDDNGTPSDSTDDTYTFSVLVTGSNVGTMWTANDASNTTGSYGTPVMFGPYPISGGNISFTITDDADGACTTVVAAPAPSTCSDLCDITSLVSNILCDDNGTPSDSTDDMYSFEVTVSGSNTATMWTATDASSTTGAYGVAVIFGPYPISGGNVSFTISDNNDAGCTTPVTVTAPAACSNTCTISHTVSNILCDDNGTPTDPNDDTFTFEVTVSGSNTATMWTATDAGSTSGSYGVVVTFGPYPISGGNVSFTISDNNDAGCTTSVTVTAPPTCSNTCGISHVVSNILCDDNGTPSDSTDDTYTFSVLVTGNNTGSSWTAADPNNTTGGYGTPVTFGPYPISGGGLTFNISDADSSGCNTLVVVAAPATCSDMCVISAVVSNVLCDDNGTPSNPNDDTYTFEVTVTGSNTASTWTANDAGSTSGAYGVAVTFGPYPISGGNVSFTITDDMDGTCSTMFTAIRPPSCSNTCNITHVISNLQCNENGTPSDPSDDTYTFDVTVMGSNTGATWTANDAGSTSGTYGVAVTFGPYPISGGNVSFTITDDVDGTCSTTFTAIAPLPCSGTCSISNVVSSVLCNDNGTPFDPSDDTYTFVVTVNGSNTGASWTATDPDGTTGGYGVGVMFGPYPISLGNLMFDIVDDDSIGCITMVNVAAPAPCSNTCSISAVTSNLTCQNNGTPSDPSDDTYTFTVLVTGSNTASMWTANDGANTTGSYGVAVTFGPYPISGGAVSFTITDNADAACTAMITEMAPPTCSDLCEITNMVSNVQCNDNGTPSDSSDDTYTFDVTVSGSNTATMWSADDAGNTSGSYGVAVTFGPYPISGGDISFTITDNADAACTTLVNVIAPAPCSDLCNINHVVSNIQCDDNGTPSDSSDDTYTFDVTVSGSNTATMWSADDAGNTSGSYGVAVSFGPYPISGGDISFTITDNADVTCTTVVNAIAPAPCSDLCSITHLVSNIQCDDNGTASDSSDDTYTFDVTVSGSNTATMWSADDAGNTSGSYGVAVTFGPYLISGGDISFTITDNADAACTTLVNVIAPAPCSDLCSITHVVSNIQCDDNGTASDPSDDTYTFEVTVSGSNTAAMWTADDASMTTGSYGVAVTFGPYPISGGNINFTITDDDDAGCTTSITAMAPTTCSGSCSISHVVSNLQCNDNGTPSDPSDDTYSFDVIVSGNNTASMWTANDAANTTGAYGVAVSFGPYPISGGDVSFTITDDNDATCMTTVNAMAPTTCSDMCDIDHVVTNILCNDSGTPSDPSDDTYTFDVTVTGSNTAAMWTANDASNTTGAYGVAVSFGPYPISGGDVNFTITDDDEPTCSTDVLGTAPATCSDLCDIDAVATMAICDDNGTPSDPSDDVFSFDVTVTGNNTALTWTADDVDMTTGGYGVATNFGPFPVSGGDITLTITDDDDPACTSIIVILAPETCSNTCSISHIVTNILCGDNGTPADPSDDTYTFEVTVSGSNTSIGWSASDAASTNGSYDVAELFGPYPISGGNVSFTITDDLQPMCTTNVTAIAPTTCSNTCLISSVVSNVLCNDNGTPVDPSDDTYTFSVVVSGANTGASWVATDPNATTGGYGVPVIFGPYLISSGVLTFTIMDDVDAGCTTSVSVTPPTTCSGTCSIASSVSNVVCDDNGTPSDPSDDTYTFDVIVTGSNTDLTWTADDPAATTGSYNVAVSFGPYPISSGSVSFIVTDDGDAGCTTPIDAVAPATCSNMCDLAGAISNIVCDDNGTPTDPSDDLFTFDVLVTGSNVGSTWIADDEAMTSGAYNVLVNFGPFLIADGDVTILITDNLDASCSLTLTAMPPLPCSNACDISHLISNIVCDDNGTPTDSTDDFYTFDIIVSGSNTGASWTANDGAMTTGAYDVVVSFGPFPISGGDINFTITDDNDATCTTDVMAMAPSTCSDLCDISQVISNILCFDNGTPSDSTDDFFTFEVTVSGSNVSSSWIANDVNMTSGPYDVVVPFGPYLISGGVVNFTIRDDSDATCTTNVSVLPPMSCSDACSISHMISNIACHDNGTPIDPSDDTYTFVVLVNGSNTGATWTATDASSTSGSYGMPVVFGPYLIANGAISFDVVDDFDPSCLTSVLVAAPNSCSGTCSISNTVSNIVCFDNGTPSDASDDIFTFDVTVNGSNTALSWTANDAGSTSGAYNISVAFGPYPISDGNVNLIITDDDDASCSTPLTVVPPMPCSQACDIDHQIFNLVCNDQGTPGDSSDDTYTFDVLVSGSNTSSTWTATDADLTSGSYNVLTSFGPYLVADGNALFAISDNNDLTCTTAVSVLISDLDCGSCTNQSIDISEFTCDPAEVGIIRDTLVASDGCDSIVITTTSLAPSTTDTVVDYTCDPSGVGMQADTFMNAFGCDSIIVTDTRFDINAIDSMSLFVMSCDPTEVGVVRDTFVNSAGCDSIVITTTSLAPSTTDTIVDYTCDPLGVGMQADTFMNTFGCDSIMVTDTRFDINAIDSMSLFVMSCDPSEVGIVRDTFVNSAGCDSIVITTTTLAPSSTNTLVDYTCDPSSVGIQADTFMNAFGCDSIIVTDTRFDINAIDSMSLFVMSCDPSEVGIVRDTFVNSAGCDSIVITTTMLAPSSTNTVVDFTCDPSSVGMQADTFMNTFGCDSIIVTDTRFDINAIDSMSLFVMSCDPSEVGIVRDTFVNSAGCDSIVITTTTLAPSDRDTITTFTCDPGNVLMSLDTFTNTFGCDSIVLIDRQFDAAAIDSSHVMRMTCEPGQVGEVRDTLLNMAGCDSIVIITYVLATSPTDTVISFTCDITMAGIQVDTLTNQFGCDSIFVRDIRFDINAADTLTFFLTTCDPSEVGVVRDTFTNISGCDSIVISTTTLLPSTTENALEFTCDPSNVGIRLDTFINADGCDSIVIVDIQFDANAVDSIHINLMTCDPLLVGVTRDTATNMAGCDSIIVTTTSLSPSPSLDFMILTCDMAEVGIFIDTFATAFGCDSIVRRNVQFDSNAVQTVTINMVSCNPADTGYFETFYVNQFGCDSIVQLTIALAQGPLTPTINQLQTCDESMVGSDTVILVSQSGCDSIVITETILGSFDLEIDPIFSTISAGDSVMLALSSSGLDWTNASIIWSPPTFLSCDSCQFVTSTPDESTTYVVTVTDAAGCVATVTSVIRVEGTSIYVPNAFSPNDDQINDAFTVYVNKPAVIEMIQIFNRWGGKVFEREEVILGEFEGWNGYVLDKPAQEGVFVYQMRVRVGNEEPIYLKGEVHLIR